MEIGSHSVTNRNTDSLKTKEIVSYAAIFCLVTQHCSSWGEALREETMAA